MSQEPTIEVFRCSACNMPQPKPFDECPQCGTIVSKCEKSRNGNSDEDFMTQDDGTSTWVDDPHISTNVRKTNLSKATDNLQSHQSTNRERIDTDEFVKDVRDHMVDSELMSKYRLSAEELRSLIDKQIDSNILLYYEIYGRPVIYEERIGLRNNRHLPRTLTAFTVRIIGAHNPESKGWIVKITTDGLKTSGINMDVGDIKTLVIPAIARRSPGEIVFDAECRWKQIQEPYGETIAGLEIKHISKDNLRVLPNLYDPSTLKADVGPSDLI